MLFKKQKHKAIFLVLWNQITMVNKISSILSDSPALRSAVISAAGKVFHILLSGGNKSLELTAKWYLRKTKNFPSLDDTSLEAIQSLKSAWQGIIISNHQSGVFSDYLPLFAALWDDILQKSIFYTGAYNLAMNQREFPDYQFRAATLKNREDVIRLKSDIQNDIATINYQWWYIFIIPSWDNTAPDAKFLAVFQRMLEQSNDDLPVLSNQVTHSATWSYSEIAKALLGGEWFKTSIHANISTVADRKDGEGKIGNWKELRQIYDYRME